METAIDQALTRIPPLWPLRHFVAVNPFCGLTGMPLAEACASLQKATGRAPLQSPQTYLAAYESGEITDADLAGVSDSAWPSARLMEILHDAEEPENVFPIATVADLLDLSRPHAHWSVFVVEEISKWCGVFFDENQTTWNSPWKSLGLFAAWRESARRDRNPEAFGLRGFRSFVRSLPDDAMECIGYCMGILDPRKIPAADFFHRQLATISGWAGHVQYRVREDALRGRENPMLLELLAIRLAYDAALFQAFATNGSFRADWRHQPEPSNNPALFEALIRWQSAFEAGYVKRLMGSLKRSDSSTAARPTAQAVFCIDVRSEVFRRHLEAAMPGLRTIGFAGFFGFPVGHRTCGDTAPATRCPVLLVPPVHSEESMDAEQARAASVRRARSGAWKAFQNSAISCFSFVESAGLAFSAALGGLRGKRHADAGSPAPRLIDVPLGTRTDLAEGALRNMGLIRDFARVVLICGHGSRSANNPFASSLECGACGGHAGDVNARLAAATLNDPEVRASLADRGIRIPDDTVFLAGLHQTVTDEVTLFDLGGVPASHGREMGELQSALATAGAAARRERAASCGLANVPEETLEGAFRALSNDISQVRPEWGLANNAAFIAAPRSRTVGLPLDGRVFLHDYDPASDPDKNVLSLILNAPVVVASWINLQYYASRVDPQYYGSGDKALHHVIGGIGVTEGNGGDLRNGLPLQSIHDGTRFMHEPRRLTVVIEAARDSIDAVLAASPGVRQLFEHGWIHLIALESECRFRRNEKGHWRELESESSRGKDTHDIPGSGILPIPACR